MRSLLLSDCIARFLAWTEANRRPKTVEHYRYQLGRLLAHAGPIDLGELTPAIVSSGPRGFHFVQAAQRLCNWCERVERSIDRNPLLGMPRPRRGGRRRTLDRAQVVKLLRAADRTFRRLLIVLRESLCRPQEARALTWADIATNGGGGRDRGQDAGGGHWFQLPTGKGFERRSDPTAERIIPISPRLARLLGRLSREGVTLDAPILLDSRGNPWTANAVRCRFRRLRVRAGLAADRRGEKVVAYTLRHTGATAAAAAGVRDFRLAGVLGHASPRTTERYVHLQPADLVDAMGAVWEAKSIDPAKKGRPGLRRNASD